MRILIIGDMEGVAGINHWDQVQAGGYLYEEGRTLYTNEINAAIRGAFDSGIATQVTVIDGHGAGAREACCKFNSIRPDQLDPRCEFVSHHRYLDYAPVIRRGYDAAFFIGIHSREGTPRGVLSHTIATSVWSNIWFNDKVVGEIGVMAALIGTFGLPFILLTGDLAACEEATDLLGNKLQTVAVKEGLSRFSAIHAPPARACSVIETAAAEALRNFQSNPGAYAPYVPNGGSAASSSGYPARKPGILEIAFVARGSMTIRFQIMSIDKIDELFRGRPGVKIDEKNLLVEASAPSWKEAWDLLYPW